MLQNLAKLNTEFCGLLSLLAESVFSLVSYLIMHMNYIAQISVSIRVMCAENTCYILGASGATGQSLVKNLLHNSTKYQKIILLNRRLLRFESYESSSNIKIEQRIINFQQLDEYKTNFIGGKTVFCCVGSSLTKATKVI